MGCCGRGRFAQRRVQPHLARLPFGDAKRLHGSPNRFATQLLQRIEQLGAQRFQLRREGKGAKVDGIALLGHGLPLGRRQQDQHRPER
jgi:hypothetical protein